MKIKRNVRKIVINGLIGLQVGSLYMVIMIFEEAAIKYLLFSILLGLIMGWIVEGLTFLVGKLSNVRGDRGEN